MATDIAYKSAIEMLSRKRAALENRQSRENLPDFSKEQPATALAPLTPIKVDLPKAEALVKNLSALFRQSPEIYTSSVSVGTSITRSWYLNSEGSAATQEASSAVLMAMAQTQAVDGTMLPDWVSATGLSLDSLPGEAELGSQIRTMADRLTRLRRAAVVDRYNGPVLFDGVAGAEAFSQVFAPKLLAMRTPTSDNPQIQAYAAQSASKLRTVWGHACSPVSSASSTTRRYPLIKESPSGEATRLTMKVCGDVPQPWWTMALLRRCSTRALPSPPFPKARGVFAPLAPSPVI